jgi:hypothetical protein
VRLRHAFAAALVFLSLPVAAAAQDPSRQALEASAGYAAFVDDSPIEHVSVGGSWRVRLSERLTLGPEVVYMRGPGSDRDVFLTGRVVLDANPGARAVLYLVADGGMMLHGDDFLDSWVTEGAGSVGGGVRFDINDRFYIAPEVRIGWEPHVRATATVGWRLK